MATVVRTTFPVSRLRRHLMPWSGLNCIDGSVLCGKPLCCEQMMFEDDYETRPAIGYRPTAARLLAWP